MYMRLTRGHFDPSKIDVLEASGIDVAAALRRLPGCLNVYQATDRARGVSIAVTLWDTEEQARFPREAMGDLVALIQQLGLRMDAPEIFEVIETAAEV